MDSKNTTTPHTGRLTVQCDLCPKACVIGPGQSGDCRVRVNLDGVLRAVTYGYPVAVHVDPVEKKPLYHFLPGTPILSLATVGCNLHCRNCQNWEISQANPEETVGRPFPPERVPAVAERYDCQSVAYTYTDPVVYYEYALDCAIQARKAGLKNVLVTAGYINPEPLRRLCTCVDAANIDLKSMSPKFYRDVCGATLEPVLKALVVAKSAGVHVEVTNLVIPTLNDRDRDLLELTAWMAENLGPQTPLHFSRFTPHYRMRNLPPTPAETLLRAREIAHATGLKHVYIGNLMVEDAGNTRCAKCDITLVSRRGYRILSNRLDHGKCPECGTRAHGVWE